MQRSMGGRLQMWGRTGSMARASCDYIRAHSLTLLGTYTEICITIFA